MTDDPEDIDRRRFGPVENPVMTQHQFATSSRSILRRSSYLWKRGNSTESIDQYLAICIALSRASGFVGVDQYLPDVAIRSRRDDDLNT